jgi:hypothetical protein
MTSKGMVSEYRFTKVNQMRKLPTSKNLSSFALGLARAKFYSISLEAKAKSV